MDTPKHLVVVAVLLFTVYLFAQCWEKIKNTPPISPPVAGERTATEEGRDDIFGDRTLYDAAYLSPHRNLQLPPHSCGGPCQGSFCRSDCWKCHEGTCTKPKCGDQCTDNMDCPDECNACDPVRKVCTNGSAGRCDFGCFQNSECDSDPNGCWECNVSTRTCHNPELTGSGFRQSGREACGAYCTGDGQCWNACSQCDTAARRCAEPREVEVIPERNQNVWGGYCNHDGDCHATFRCHRGQSRCFNVNLFCGRNCHSHLQCGGTCATCSYSTCV